MAQLAEEKKEDESHVTASTMKAIVCTAYGDPKDALKLMDVPMIQHFQKLFKSISLCHFEDVESFSQISSKNAFGPSFLIFGHSTNFLRTSP